MLLVHLQDFLEVENLLFRKKQKGLQSGQEDLLPTEACRRFLSRAESKTNPLRILMLWLRVMVETAVETERTHRAMGDVMVSTRSQLGDLSLNALVRIRKHGNLFLFLFIYLEFLFFGI